MLEQPLRWGKGSEQGLANGRSGVHQALDPVQQLRDRLQRGGAHRVHPGNHEGQADHHRREGVQMVAQTQNTCNDGQNH